uniref:glycine receptor subunit beta n=1 Tax=Myxine glutinosa TaxID=7769 RepID=UPI00358F06EF
MANFPILGDILLDGEDEKALPGEILQEVKDHLKVLSTNFEGYFDTHKSWLSACDAAELKKNEDPVDLLHTFDMQACNVAAEELSRSKANSTSNIINRLLQNYDPRIRPNFKGPPVDARVNIFINSFGSIHETTMEYRVNIFLRQTWNDPRLKFPTDYQGPDLLTIDPKLFKCLWKPDLFFANEKDANFHDVTQENILLFISRKSDVLLSMRLSLVLSCPLDLTLFPMDTQRCKMQLESFGYTTEDLRFIWEPDDPVQMNEIALPQFDIAREEVEYRNCTKFYEGTGHYTCVEVIFTLRRQVGFYMMGVYAPTLLIVVLSWLSFWINPDASAARVPLGIFSVLSLSSESMSFSAQLPKVSYVKAIDVWLIMCLVFTFASLVEYAVVQVMLNSPGRIAAEMERRRMRERMKENVYGGEEEVDTRDCTSSAGEPSSCYVTSNGMSTPGRFGTLQDAEARYKRVCMSRSDLRTPDFSIVGSLPQDFKLTNYDCYGQPVRSAKRPNGHVHCGGSRQPTGRHRPAKVVIPPAAKHVDHYSRALFPLCFFLFNIVYWSVYLWE